MRWALIESGRVANVVEQDYQPQIVGEWVECGDAGPGWAHVGGGGFTPPLAADPPMATLVITAVVADDEHAPATVVQSMTEVTCPAGAVLHFTAEMRDLAGELLPVSDLFRMPIRSRDGREKVLLATMVDGIVSITAPMRESGVWAATAAGINEALPEGAKMSFSGATVYVYEAA